MKVKLEELEAIVRNRICSLCDTRTVDGACGAQEPEHCPVLSLFPLVVQAVDATESDKLQDYVDAIHENVCSVCIDQRLDGTCPQREEKRCALDAYMPQIIEVIEEALGRPPAPGNLPAASTR